MTRVLIDLRVMRPDGSHVPADGVTRWRPVVARVHEGHVDLPASFRAAPDATIDVTPSILPGGSVVVAYEVDEAVSGGRLRWVLVPDSADIVAYSALVEVDPGSLEPGADPDPAWWAALTDYRAETGAARDEAVGAADDAAGSAQSAESAAGTATAAAGSASDAARAVAEDRTAVETAHGLVTDAAQAAGLDAETAVRAAGDAMAARDLAVPAAATATAARDVAVAARDATLAAVVITGAGRPDVSASMTAEVRALVAAATSGAEFRSLDGPQGAWVWRKRGTTWECVEGDTGWLRVTRWDTAGVVTGQALSAAWAPLGAAADGYISVRRTASAIMVALQRLQKLGVTPATVWETFVLPAGFRPEQVIGGLGLADVGLTLRTTGELQRLDGTAAAPNGPLTGSAFPLLLQGPPVAAWPLAYPPTI